MSEPNSNANVNVSTTLMDDTSAAIKVIEMYCNGSPPTMLVAAATHFLMVKFGQEAPPIVSDIQADIREDELSRYKAIHECPQCCPDGDDELNEPDQNDPENN